MPEEMVAARAAVTGEVSAELSISHEVNTIFRRAWNMGMIDYCGYLCMNTLESTSKLALEDVSRTVIKVHETPQDFIRWRRERLRLSSPV
jgi:hypothetical protein